MGRRRARSTRASPASLHWRFHLCARCRAASALLQPLSSSPALGRRRARSLEASVTSIYSLAFLTLSAVQGCKCFTAAAALAVGSRPSPCSLARRECRQLPYAGISTAMCAEDQEVLGRLGMHQVRLIFPNEEEWRNPALLLRRTYPAPEYLGAKRRRGKEKGQCFRGRDSALGEEEGRGQEENLSRGGWTR